MMVRHRMSIVVAAHGLLFATALLAAFFLAYNFRWVTVRDDGPHWWFTELYLPLLAIAVPVKLLAFYQAGQYRGSWRYVGLRDLFGVISASLVGSFVFLFLYFLVENLWRPAYGHALIDRQFGQRHARSRYDFSIGDACADFLFREMHYWQIGLARGFEVRAAQIAHNRACGDMSAVHRFDHK